MLPASSGATDNLAGAHDPVAARALRCWLTACERFEDERLAGAAVMLRAAGRVVLTGAGVGLDAARFGALALREAGFEAQATHAADLASGAFPLRPGDVVLGIDTGRRDLPAALTRARDLGLHTLGLTDRDLTLIDPDVLAHYVEPEGPPAPAGPSPLPVCAVLYMLVARTEPSAALAFDAATFQRQIEKLAAARDVAARFVDAVGDSPVRLWIAGAGPTTWIAASAARRINRQQMGPPGLVAIAAHLSDLSEPDWPFQPTDAVITLEPADAGTPVESANSAPVTCWRIGGPRAGASLHTQVHASSPALASLGMSFVVEFLLDELASR